MRIGRCWLLAFIVGAFVTSGFAQKVKVGYDKRAGFLKYNSCTVG
jgi:hypothetical protein